MRCDAEDSDASAPHPERTPPPSSDTDGFESDEEIMPLLSYGTHILPIHVTMTYLTADPGLPGLRRKLLATRRANRQRQTSESQRGGDRIRSRQSAVKLTPSQMQADERIQQEVAVSKPVAMPPTPVMTNSLPPSSQRAIALAEFQKEKHHNGQIKNQHNGRLPVEQDIESFLIQGAERVRLQKRRRDDLVAQMDDQRDFFPSIATDAEAAAHDDEAMRVNLDLTNSGAEEHLKWNTPLRSCYLPPHLRFDAPTTSKPEPTGATNHKAIPRMHDQEEQEKKFAEEIKKKLSAPKASLSKTSLEAEIKSEATANTTIGTSQPGVSQPQSRTLNSHTTLSTGTDVVVPTVGILHLHYPASYCSPAHDEPASGFDVLVGSTHDYMSDHPSSAASTININNTDNLEQRTLRVFGEGDRGVAPGVSSPAQNYDMLEGSTEEDCRQRWEQIRLKDPLPLLLWSAKLDGQLLELRACSEPWTTIAECLNKTTGECKQRFKEIRPKGWMPKNAKQKKKVKSKNPPRDTIVHDKELGEKIGLQDAFDLAQAMHKDEDIKSVDKETDTTALKQAREQTKVTKVRLEKMFDHSEALHTKNTKLVSKLMRMAKAGGFSGQGTAWRKEIDALTASEVEELYEFHEY
ncbi:hypothetical protein SLS59_005134 [Nothophoma quercina]|uniref:Myb-like domain-containing protein n=1 Tax=Nothophoma quercina TaxID=749835 RepID=A0ABR3RCE2_9PLEO